MMVIKRNEILKRINNKLKRTTQPIQPYHGYVISPLSRAGFLISKGLLGSPWPANEMEGGKNFPNYTGGQFARQGNEEAFYTDTDSSTPPEDGLILSGGRDTSGRIIVNYTDQELERLTGTKGGWPKLPVNSGSTFYVTWNYQAAHKTRGYRWYITRPGWDTTERPTRASFDLVPIHSDFNPDAPYWSYSSEAMAPWNNLSVTLPSRVGHHILLCVWIVADTGMGFYQAFDLDFDDDGQSNGGTEGEDGGNGEGENEPNIPEEDYPTWSPNSVQYYVGDYVIYKDALYVCTQANVSNSGWAPGTATTLWRLVS
ncbi:lytic polysaccharide monooxygenase [Citrobacter sp. JGM124]|uniref:lytic polysaccharide monooxygenase n=1 Tax=Citrobacter sp. JGM124 TaxID=2799789 RepID=UPI001BAD6B0C|nr:lytic polysaccharide monooxygenase [Citrobacter sp. JGM124]MBS0849807.1 lytic polysaccharide monooxygenase [Citrobacter sp. JGM124]